MILVLKLKKNVNENIILLIEKTKQDLFELLGDKDYKK
jgi:hypothetical protein